MFGVISKEAVSLKRDAVRAVGWESRLLCWHRYMVSATLLMRGVATHGWPLGSGHPALTCEPPGWPVRVGPTVTPHAVTLDWGCHACAAVSCQVWQGFLQHVCLLASFPVGLYSDRAPDSALDRRRETYQLWLHCFRDFAWSRFDQKCSKVYSIVYAVFQKWHHYTSKITHTPIQFSKLSMM